MTPDDYTVLISQVIQGCFLSVLISIIVMTITILLSSFMRTILDKISNMFGDFSGLFGR